MLDKKNKPQILLVDDDHDIVNYLTLVGQFINIDIAVAYNYKEAMEKISQQDFAGYIIDVNLPDGSGIQLIELIRKKFTDVQIALLSNFKNTNDAKEWKEKFAINYIVRKPVNDKELKDLFNNLIREANAVDKNDPNYLLEELKREYEASVDEKLQDIESLLKKAIIDPSVENFTELKSAVHKIAGSAGTFGFNEASNICLELDRKLQPKKNPQELSTFFAENLLTSFLPKLHKAFSSRHSNGFYIPVSLINKQIQILSSAYAEDLLPKVSQIKANWEKVKKGQQNRTMFFLVNNLAGSAGSFGFTMVSQCASQICEELDDHLSAENMDRIDDLLEKLTENTNSELKKFTTTQKASIKAPKANFSLVFSMLTNPEENYQIGAIADCSVKSFASCSDLMEELTKEIPFVLLVDKCYFKNNDFLIEIPTIKQHVPIVFVLDEHDFTFYLLAIRAGISDFLTRPLSHEKLIAKLSKFSHERIYEPFAVLIIDDDIALAENYALVLRKVGMDTKVVNDPGNVLQALNTFMPDVILTDVNMPFCSGIELAKIIRQYEYFRDIPIIFLSTDKNFDKQLAAMEQGEAFLQKPIQPQQLIAAVQKWGQQFLRKQAIKQTLRKYDEQVDETLLVHELRQERIKRKRLEEAVENLQREMDALYDMHGEDNLKTGAILQGNTGEKYTIVKTIASGGMGITYLAMREKSSEQVVIKTLAMKYQKNPKDSLRFYNESQCLVKVNHPNLVCGYDYYHGQSLCFIVMEYIKGKTVAQLIEELLIIDVALATQIIYDVAQALAYLEEQHIIHRDVKPQNIILGQKTTKLVDFGIAKTETNYQMAMTTTDIVIGTPFYLSPEQLCSKEIDSRSDIFSLGATYFHMVTGQLPFDGRTTLEVMHKRLVYSPNPQELNPDLPDNVTAIIKKMMKINASQRYSSARDLITDLEDVLKISKEKS
ncbi:protein kinase domain-containing protein [Candidatus Uabimicrobium amorphum]|uniref:Protein kinase n=1 Tax=Uabimicrobium amorphum TaxID=2596890 RepID=A0A5S9F287_UABAM|nr:response regulator [Candidatus Uabimicrobium amorphum]BBM83407.1 protein kinase [Candidatus Uabimicrobium amorphum]